MNAEHSNSLARLPVLKAEVIPMAGEGAVERTTRLSQQLMAAFAIPTNMRIPGLTRLPAPDNLTNIRQWLALADPDVLHRDPGDAQWQRIVQAFAQALRAL
jgi:hypothetical protein